LGFDQMPQVLHADEMNRCIGCYSCMLACARLVYHSYSPRRSAIQIRTAGGMQGRFVADICRACQEPPCAAACPTGALSPRPGGGVRLDRDQCIGCQACGEACVVGAIAFLSDDPYPIVCRHCGVCVRYCPHDCLNMA